MKTVYVLGGRHNADWLQPIYPRIVSLGITDLPWEEYPLPELLLFTGGQDINPALYGEKHDYISFSPQRDNWEVAWYAWAEKNEVPMFGICRGMQLLTAMTGGKLIPHVNNHSSNGHLVACSKKLSSETIFRVNSLHHQMCVPAPSVQMLAWAKGVAFKDKLEPEALYFPEIRSLGVQWHPEMMPNSSKATEHVLNWINFFIEGNKT